MTESFFGAGALPRDCCSGVSMRAGGGLRFGSHRQPLQTGAAARYSCSFGVFVVHGHPGRMGFGRLLSGVVSGSHPAPSVEEFGPCQPKPRAWRRKHIADGPEGELVSKIIQL
jgi:hypothetical protein